MFQCTYNATTSGRYFILTTLDWQPISYEKCTLNGVYKERRYFVKSSIYPSKAPTCSKYSFIVLNDDYNNNIWSFTKKTFFSREDLQILTFLSRGLEDDSKDDVNNSGRLCCLKPSSFVLYYILHVVILCFLTQWVFISQVIYVKCYKYQQVVQCSEIWISSEILF